MGYTIVTCKYVDEEGTPRNTKAYLFPSRNTHRPAEAEEASSNSSSPKGLSKICHLLDRFFWTHLSG